MVGNMAMSRHAGLQGKSRGEKVQIVLSDRNTHVYLTGTCV